MTSISNRKYQLFLFILIFFILCAAPVSFAADSEQTVIKKYPNFADVIKTVKETVRTNNFDLLKKYTEKNGKSSPPYWLPEYQDEPDDMTYDEFISKMINISQGVQIKMTGKYEIWNPSSFPIIDIETIGWRGDFKTVFLRFSYWDMEKKWTLMGIYLTSERMK